jgi:hypothetical protein
MGVSYEVTFAGLAALSSLLLVSQPTRQSMLKEQAYRIKRADPHAKVPHQAAKHPQSRVYKVYFVMVVSAWLQVTLSDGIVLMVT